MDKKSKFADIAPDLNAIKGEHEQLSMFVQCIKNAKRRHASPDYLQVCLTQMLEFARAHIQDEEAVMAAVSYPDISAHRASHEQILHNLTAAAFDIGQSADQDLVALEELLDGWIEGHFKGPDLRFQDYLVDFHLRRMRSSAIGEIQDDPSLQLERERFRAIVEASPNAILVVDSAGIICVVNSQAERLFGYERNELLGKALEMLVPARIRSRHTQTRSTYFASPEVRSMGAGRDLFGLRKDGVEVPIEIGLSPLQTAGERFVLASIIDISKRKELDTLVREAHADALRDSILKSLPSSVIATDTEGRIVAVNPAAERLLGYGREELIGQPVLMLHDRAELQRRATEISKVYENGVAIDFHAFIEAGSADSSDGREWIYCRRDGTPVPVQIALTTLRGPTDQISGFLAVANDITERKRAEASIRYMADHDALTGLPNRNLLIDRLGMAMRQATRSQTQVALLLLDLDQFKQVNDSLGHHIGDELLLAVARRILAQVRSVDTVARLGGDEFVVVVTDVTSKDELHDLVEQISKAVSMPLTLDRYELHVTPSIGGCVFPQDGEDAGTLLKKADVAMYRVKASGRGSFKWFTESMMLESQEKLLIGNSMRHALDRGEFALCFQPKISLTTGRIIGSEALLRWRNDRNENILPTRFVPIAEDTGLIVSLGEWVLETACRHCVDMQKQMQRPLAVAVNVSSRQFTEKNWLQFVLRTLSECGLRPEDLELEITESILMQNTEEAAALLGAFRDRGIRIVVDDFGTGYSSLSYLTRFPIDKIKIDRSFVRDMVTDAKDAAVVNAIIAMSKKLDIEVVAEGVETADQQQYLIAQACDEAQGFYYSKGLPIGDLMRDFAAIEEAVRLPSH